MAFDPSGGSLGIKFYVRERGRLSFCDDPPPIGVKIETFLRHDRVIWQEDVDHFSGAHSLP